MFRQPHYLRFMLFVILVMIGCGVVSAQSAGDDSERILSFKAYYRIGQDGTLSVTEKIRVRTEGREIRHGIYRILPTVYDREAGKVSVQITAQDIRRNNVAETFAEKASQDRVKFQLGTESTYLDPGEYLYEINYIVSYPIRYNYSQDADALYWNVTGHEWGFAMDTVEAYVSLPDAAVIDGEKIAAYSGPDGTTTCQCLFQTPSPGTASFRMTEKLLPGEGFTIVVPFTKGIVAFEENPAFTSWEENAQTELLICAGIILIFYLLIWMAIGRKSIPAFTGAGLPGFRISPAAVRYVQQMKYDIAALIAAVLSMVEKGYLTIQRITSEEGTAQEDYELAATGNDVQALSDDEKVLAGYLFKGRDAVRLKQSREGWLTQGYAAHKRTVEQQCNGVYLKKNGWWKFIVIVFALAVLSIGFLRAPLQGMIAGFVAIPFIGGGTAGLMTIMQAGRKTISMVIFVSLFFTFWFGFLFFVISTLVGPLYFVAIVAVSFSAAFLLGRLSTYTSRGVEVIEQIAMFRNFINQANGGFQEDQKAAMMRLLPYAAAIDLTGKFKDLVPEYAYADQADSTTGLHRIALFDTFSSSMTYAAIDSSTSSDGGSSGGGSSGGGDSGGGGGGW